MALSRRETLVTTITSAAAVVATTSPLHQLVTYSENVGRHASRIVTVCLGLMARMIRCAAHSDSAPMASYVKEKRLMVILVKVRVNVLVAIASRINAGANRMRGRGE